MLLVRTKLDRSQIHGIGLFADEFIPKGAVVWELNQTIDLALTQSEVENLSETSRAQVLKYSYLDSVTGKYVFCGDDARFFNHSNAPNCIDVAEGPYAGRTLARRDIFRGEELTCDYSLFDAEFAHYAVRYEPQSSSMPAFAV